MEKEIRKLDFEKKRKDIWGDKVTFGFEGEKVSYREFNLKIFEEDQKVGTVRINHYSKPFNFFYIAGINVESKFRRLSDEQKAGIGGSILRNINKFLDERKGGQLGVLQDSIFVYPENHPVLHNMYYEHDWTELGNGTHLIYEGRPITEKEREILKELF